LFGLAGFSAEKNLFCTDFFVCSAGFSEEKNLFCADFSFPLPGFLPFKTDLCEAFLARTLAQARKVNSVVYLIGDKKYENLAQRLNIILEPYADYADTVEWFDRNYGNMLPEGVSEAVRGAPWHPLCKIRNESSTDRQVRWLDGIQF